MATFHFQEFFTVIWPLSKKNGAAVAADGTNHAKLAIIQIITVIPAVGSPATATIGIARL